jgi:cell division protein FtsQ
MKSMKARIWKSLFAIVAVIALTLAGYGSYTIVHYMRTSPRFEIRKVEVVGLKRVEQTEVLAQAQLPDAANVFSVNLDEVRERVEELKWVRFASVQRVLPDMIAINIVERQPVGLARIRKQILQFDTEAELLERDQGTGMNAPILDGLKPNDREGNKKKVGLYRRIMDDLHGQGELSEIHIDDAGEVSVISLNEPLLVRLGTDDFRARWGMYLRHRAQIQRDYPEAVQVDFRFANQVILRMNPESPDEQEKVVWDAEKKSL